MLHVYLAVTLTTMFNLTNWSLSTYIRSCLNECFQVQSAVSSAHGISQSFIVSFMIAALGQMFLPLDTMGLSTKGLKLPCSFKVMLQISPLVTKETILLFFFRFIYINFLKHVAIML